MQSLISSAVCQTYAESVKANEPPHVIIDATLSGDSSEVVKAFSMSLAIPTVSGSYGQEGDIRYNSTQSVKNNTIIKHSLADNGGIWTRSS